MALSYGSGGPAMIKTRMTVDEAVCAAFHETLDAIGTDNAVPSAHLGDGRYDRRPKRSGDASHLAP